MLDPEALNDKPLSPKSTRFHLWFARLCKVCVTRNGTAVFEALGLLREAPERPLSLNKWTRASVHIIPGP